MIISYYYNYYVHNVDLKSFSNLYEYYFYDIGTHATRINVWLSFTCNRECIGRYLYLFKFIYKRKYNRYTY